MTYIATFFSHFGAIRFKKMCTDQGWPAVLMPVPRNLSSSCGTCVRFTSTQPTEEPYSHGRSCPIETPSDEVEQIVEVTPSGYVFLYRAEGI